VDGNRLIDYVLSWGPLILGHAHPEVVAALIEAAEHGTSYGAPCEQEIELARSLHERMPGIEMIRFVNSGTEATMSALRLARAFTARPKIIKFAGCYHGHADQLLVKAGSGVATLGLPDSPGVPPGAAQDTLVARFNDLDSVRRIFERHPTAIAAVIVEPVAGNMGVVPPEVGFLEGLREITREEGGLLIFDEVMTGFRVHPGGAQALFQISPDLTTLGKVIGGGLPIGAYGGRREIMELVAPSGPVYQAGTLSGNPLAMTVGLKTLEILGRPGVWPSIEQAAASLERGLREAAADAGVDLQCVRVGTMMTAFFHQDRPRDWDSASTSDTERFGRFFHRMLDEGVQLPPSQFEAFFLSAGHDHDIIEQTLAAARRSLHLLSA
jgi:glutamate-1-semialdehyde 2,1-aminomutase